MCGELRDCIIRISKWLDELCRRGGCQPLSCTVGYCYRHVRQVEVRFELPCMDQYADKLCGLAEELREAVGGDRVLIEAGDQQLIIVVMIRVDEDEREGQA